jgi:stage II sporulation protein D
VSPLALTLLLATGIVDDLYGHRLLFDDAGQPQVPLGMMQGQKRVLVRGVGGAVTVVAGDASFDVDADTDIVITWVSGTPAVTRALLVLETLEGEARGQKRASVQAWASKGVVDVKAFDVGGVYGVKGTVVDNRAALITAPRVPSGLDVRTVPLEWLEKKPAAVMRVHVDGRADVDAGFVRIKSSGTAKAKKPIFVAQVEHSIGYAEHGFADRVLRDEVVVVPDKGGALAVVNVVDENSMVAGVLPSEMFSSAPMEALKAQAVTARGELFSKIGRRHFTDPHLVCSEQHCQVYKGVTAEHPRTNEAAAATAGELAFIDGHVVDSVYSSCCGGHTEPADIVWDRPKKQELVGRPDAPDTAPKWLKPELAPAFFAGPAHAQTTTSPTTTTATTTAVPEVMKSDADVRRFLALPRESAWCGRSTLNQKGTAWRWEKRFTRAELDAAFADLGVGVVNAVAVEERGPGGRLRALVVTGSAGQARVLRELPVRKRLGNLKSGLFVVDEERDDAGALLAVVLRGAGFGHGSGMCQQGAIGMAEAGASYKDILRHYYNGAEVKSVF